MESGSTNQDNPSGPLTDEQRAALFAQFNSGVGRDGRNRIVRPAIPQKFVAFVIAACVILGLGGVVVEHFYGGIGTSRPPITGSTSLATTLPLASGPGSPHPHRSLSAFIGLREIANATAPLFSLRDQRGNLWDLRAQRGRVVVLTFFDQSCNDICTVEVPEIALARRQLGALTRHIEFAIVNSDPGHPRDIPRPLALRTTRLEGQPLVYFLNGPLTQLNQIWTHYGLRVQVGRQPTQVAHNNLVYFIDPDGKLRALAIPFAHRDRHDRFVLSPSALQRFASGIAFESVSLAR